MGLPWTTGFRLSSLRGERLRESRVEVSRRVAQVPAARRVVRPVVPAGRTDPDGPPFLDAALGELGREFFRPLVAQHDPGGPPLNRLVPPLPVGSPKAADRRDVDDLRYTRLHRRV